MSNITVTTEQGKVCGQADNDYYGGVFYLFCGIPYAKAPVGHLRFKEPQSPEPWHKTLNGTKEGPSCPHIVQPFRVFVGHEDNCLNLNIFTKQINGKNPVMVMIHGGGYVFGSNNRSMYGPKYLMTADIVLVTINYRLGIFGFLSLEDRSLNVPGNMGLKDQVMALRWIKKNIHNFGGDPDNVTIFGESAGSASVHYLMLSPLAKGLFHKAIMQSGSSLNPWARGKRNALDAAKALGYLETSERDILERLMHESAKAIAREPSRIPDVFLNAVERPYGPVIEYEHKGAFLTKDPLDLLRSGDYNKVPVIIGHNSFEGIMFNFLKNLNGMTIPRSLECDVPFYLNIPAGSKTEQEITRSVKKFYYQDEEISDDNIEKRFLIMGDTNFVYGILKTVQMMSRHQPIYLYRNSLEGPLNFFKMICLSEYVRVGTALISAAIYCGIKPIEHFIEWCMHKVRVSGVSHADDVFYLFSTCLSHNYAKGTEEDLGIQKFVKLWTNFAKFSNPTPTADSSLDNIIWEPVVGGDIKPVFNIDKRVRLLGENLETESFTFWDNIHKYDSRFS